MRFVWVLVVALFATSAQAQPMQLIVGASSSSLHTQYARVFAKVASDMTKREVVVRNIPGGGGRSALAYATDAGQTANDILVFVSNQLPLDLALCADCAPVSKINWIGSLSGETSVLAVRPDSPLQSFASLRDRPTTMGLTAQASAAITVALANKYLGTNIKAVRGYANNGEVMLAVQRGEVDLANVTIVGMEKRGESLKPLIQLGMHRDPDLPGTPAIGEIVDNDTYPIFQLAFSKYEAAHPIVMAPTVSHRVVLRYRKLFDAVTVNPAYRDFVKGHGLEYAPITGAALAAMYGEVADRTVVALRGLTQ